MVNTIIIDFSRTLIFPKDVSYAGKLNDKYLRSIGKEGNFKFLDNFALNTELLNFLQSLKGRAALFMYTTGTIQDVPEVKEVLERVFDRIFTIVDTDTDKRDPKSYDKLAHLIGKDPTDILFVDDNPENLTAAKLAGYNTLQYTNNTTIMESIKKLLNLK